MGMNDVTVFDGILETLYNALSSYKFYVPVMTICIAFLVIRFSQRLVKKLINKDSKSLETKRKNTVVVLVQNIIKYLIIIIAVLIILSVWGLDVSGFLAGLGIVGVVGGLALQDALKDIIMGLNIIMDNYYVVGDLVRFNDFTGEVIEFGLKNTKIKNVDGVVLVVSNREISAIYNLSQKSSSVAITVPIAYEEKEEKVAKVLESVCKMVDELKVSTDKTVYLGIDSFGDSSVNYLIRAYCKAGDQYDFRRMILNIVKRELDKNKIKIPYPQVEVHNGKNV
ncbi:MAG: mechanosensitive ion channel family protein [Erysipelotrichales bacterium]|nr:mechanosensitive ion channel family protein [Erysipelotrichales bacterium]